MSDVVVLEEIERAYDDGTLVSIRVLRVPDPDTYADGVKYKFHYGVRTGDTIIRFDNHHGPHELHLGDTTFDYDEFPGWQAVFGAFLAALPPEKRAKL